MFLRVRGNPEQVRQALLDRLSSIDAGIANVMTLKTMTGMQAYLLRVAFWVATLLGGLALILASTRWRL